MTDDDFVRAVRDAKLLGPREAETPLRKLYERAIAEGRSSHARVCLHELSICLTEQGRYRDSLRLELQVAREDPSPYSVCSVAYALERYGWWSFAVKLFERVLTLPERENAPVSWRDHARAGIERIMARKLGTAARTT